MDVLSDVLMAVRLSGAVFFDVRAWPPFVTASPSSDLIRNRLLSDVGHVIGFHVVTSGACWAESLDSAGPAQELRAGQIVIYPGGDANLMLSSPGMRAEPDWRAYYRAVQELRPLTISVNEGADDEPCRYVCGYLACDARPFNPLLSSLPPMVRERISRSSWEWMRNLLDAAVQASTTADAGREAILAKLAELMFVDALRTYIAGLPANARGWVAGLRDPQVGAALRVLHERPAQGWTLDRLAREVGMSRSSFTDRFTGYVGMPPMQDLTRWRLQLAARMLDDGNATVERVSAAVGYESDAAFSRAFKRYVGETPGAWRRRGE
ncbi:MAG: AraC family transcriptional regulator [Aldersonia sp.]|nr:AraC family transcriptional regulator [Aldersonia sp.]